MTNILGISAYHGDSSVCLVQNGELIAAVEEERFNRIKHWAGLPAASIRYCLEEGDIQLHDLDHIAISYNSKANFSRKLLFSLKNRPPVELLLERFKKQQKSGDFRHELAQACGSDADQIKARLHNLEHHST
jgi:carbamoyltransferase